MDEKYETLLLKLVKQIDTFQKKEEKKSPRKIQ